jgi:hypothetical protein
MNPQHVDQRKARSRGVPTGRGKVSGNVESFRNIPVQQGPVIQRNVHCVPCELPDRANDSLDLMMREFEGEWLVLLAQHGSAKLTEAEVGIYAEPPGTNDLQIGPLPPDVDVNFVLPVSSRFDGAEHLGKVVVGNE